MATGDQIYIADRPDGGAGDDLLSAYSYKGGGTLHSADLINGGSNITPGSSFPFEDRCDIDQLGHLGSSGW